MPPFLQEPLFDNKEYRIYPIFFNLGIYKYALLLYKNMPYVEKLQIII